MKRRLVIITMTVLVIGCSSKEKQTATYTFGSLRASVAYDGKHFIISNLDNFEWYGAVFSVNCVPYVITGQEYILLTKNAIPTGVRDWYRAEDFQTRSFEGRRFHFDRREVDLRSFYINVFDKYGLSYDWYGEFYPNS